MHREIMLSATYQLGSDPRRTECGGRSGNRLLGGWIAAAGRGVVARRPAGGVGQSRPHARRADARPDNDAIAGARLRQVSRHNLDGLLRLFDFPDANMTSESGR